MEEEYTGTYALVHPDLADDPAQKQGQIGMISYAEPEQDNFYVSFGKGQPALYSADALLVLQKHQDIHANAVANFRELSTDDFRTLLKISLAQQSGQPNQLRHALEMAAANPFTREHSMVNLDQKYSITASIDAENERALLVREQQGQHISGEFQQEPAYGRTR